MHCVELIDRIFIYANVRYWNVRASLGNIAEIQSSEIFLGKYVACNRVDLNAPQYTML